MAKTALLVFALVLGISALLLPLLVEVPPTPPLSPASATR
jgi:hypothetical protein